MAKTALLFLHIFGAYACTKFLNNSTYKTIEINKMDDIQVRIENEDFIISEFVESDFYESVDEENLISKKK